MGTDKALMRGGVERLRQVAIQCHADRIVTLCGAKERESMFKGEVWADPLSCTTLSEVIEWALSLIGDSVQFICCDAFNLEKDGLQQLISSGGVFQLMRRVTGSRCLRIAQRTGLWARATVQCHLSFKN